MRDWLKRHFPPGWWKSRKALIAIFVVMLPEIVIVILLVAGTMGFDF